MEIKKSKKANLENKRMIIFQSGLVIALSLVLVAFEWNSTKQSNVDLGSLGNIDVAEELIPITHPETPPPPPPPPPPRPLDIINIVTNDVDIIEEIEIEDTEIEESMSVDMYYVEDEPEEESFVPFYKVEEKPEFIGGEKALLLFLRDHTKYPEAAKEVGIQGKVYVEFIIDEKGYVKEAKVMRAVHPLLDNEALRVVRSMPRWKPGIQGGKKVSVNFNVPISFVLQ